MSLNFSSGLTYSLSSIQLLVKKLQREIQHLKSELAMHDTLVRWSIRIFYVPKVCSRALHGMWHFCIRLTVHINCALRTWFNPGKLLFFYIPSEEGLKRLISFTMNLQELFLSCHVLFTRNLEFMQCPPLPPCKTKLLASKRNLLHWVASRKQSGMPVWSMKTV